MASLSTAGVSTPWRGRLMLVGPAIMGSGLMAMALLMSQPSIMLLVPAIVVLGIGMGLCWPFVAHCVMSGAQTGDEAVAAAAVPTIQQMGFALGAALAGLIANASGLAAASADEGMIRAAFWVPASFVVSAALACLASLGLQRLPGRR